MDIDMDADTDTHEGISDADEESAARRGSAIATLREAVLAAHRPSVRTRLSFEIAISEASARNATVKGLPEKGLRALESQVAALAQALFDLVEASEHEGEATLRLTIIGVERPMIGLTMSDFVVADLDLDAFCEFVPLILFAADTPGERSTYLVGASDRDLEPVLARDPDEARLRALLSRPLEGDVGAAAAAIVLFAQDPRSADEIRSDLARLLVRLGSDEQVLKEGAKWRRALDESTRAMIEAHARAPSATDDPEAEPLVVVEASRDMRTIRLSSAVTDEERGALVKLSFAVDRRAELVRFMAGAETIVLRVGGDGRHRTTCRMAGGPEIVLEGVWGEARDVQDELDEATGLVLVRHLLAAAAEGEARDFVVETEDAHFHRVRARSVAEALLVALGILGDVAAGRVETVRARLKDVRAVYEALPSPSSEDVPQPDAEDVDLVS